MSLGRSKLQGVKIVTSWNVERTINKQDSKRQTRTDIKMFEDVGGKEACIGNEGKCKKKKLFK